ncbi:collagen-like triple helix repeat-containing protein, partial [Paenibacillus polymyxa]
MAVLSTGPIANDPVLGVRPTQLVTVKIDNRDSVNSSTVLIEGFILNGSRTLYVQQLVAVGPNVVLTRNFFAGFDAFEFVFTTSGPAEDETQISVWGKDALGQLVPAHRLVSDE